MTGNLKIILGALLLGLAGSASAQTALEKQLAGALEARKDKLNLDTTKVKSEWKLAHNGKTSGKGCVITYYSGLSDAALAYVGPTADWNEAFFLVSGSSVPQVAEPTPRKITLSTDGEPDRTVTANLLTIKGEKAGEATAMILFSLPSVEAGLDVMQDSEGVRVTIDKKQVFSLAWKDGHAARDQMRACLAGKVN
jgi:hypothetical protein